MVGAIRHQAITSTNVDPIMSLGHNEFNKYVFHIIIIYEME